MVMLGEMLSGVIHREIKACCGSIYPWFKLYFLCFKVINYHTLPYPKTKDNNI